MPAGAQPLPSPLNQAISARIQEAMDSQGLSIRRVAAEAGTLSFSQLSRLLSNNRPWYVDQLDVVCTALGLRIGKVLDEADRATASRATPQDEIDIKTLAQRDYGLAAYDNPDWQAQQEADNE